MLETYAKNLKNISDEYVEETMKRAYKVKDLKSLSTEYEYAMLALEAGKAQTEYYVVTAKAISDLTDMMHVLLDKIDALESKLENKE